MDTQTVSRQLRLIGIPMTTNDTWDEVKYHLTSLAYDIAVFPENALDYLALNSRISVLDLIAEITELSAELEISIVPGTYYSEGKVIAPVISYGKLLGEMVKFPNVYGMTSSFDIDRIPIFEIDGYRVCVLICRDIERTYVLSIVRQLIKDVDIDLIVNPATIVMSNDLVFGNFDFAFEMAKETIFDKLVRLASSLRCMIFRVDWASSMEDSLVGTSGGIDDNLDVILPEVSDETFSMAISG